ncbi:MAG: hypothetical protein PUC44_03490 [Eubacteriales bacterium]|nr:hypothetical protein [Eubacteriales bacterium]
MRYIFYLLFFAGVCLLEYPLLRNWMMRIPLHIQRRRRLRSDLLGSLPARNESRVIREIRKLLESTDSRWFRNNPAGLLFSAAAAGCAVFFILLLAEGFFFAVVFSAAVFLLPFIFLRLNLKEVRVESSREGDVLIRELLNQYRIRGGNMKEAIEAAAESISGAPHSRHILLELAKGLNQAYTDAEIRKCLDTFRYSLDTSWGSALASAIYYSHVRGISVTDALTDLSESLIRSRSVLEWARRENSEAGMMLHVLAPLCYGLSAFAAVFFFHFTPWKFIRYQFGTALGLRWFLFSAFGVLIGFILEKVLSKEKMDF